MVRTAYLDRDMCQSKCRDRVGDPCTRRSCLRNFPFGMRKLGRKFVRVILGPCRFRCVPRHSMALSEPRDSSLVPHYHSSSRSLIPQDKMVLSSYSLSCRLKFRGKSKENNKKIKMLSYLDKESFNQFKPAIGRCCFSINVRSKHKELKLVTRA